MTCPHCGSEETSRRRRRSSLGYRASACRACRRIFNERTGSGVQRAPVPHRHRAARHALAAAGQAQLPRRCRTAPPAWIGGHARDHPGLGVPLRSAARQPVARQAAGPCRRVLVRRRDVREGRGTLVLSVPRHRPRWGSHRFDAQRAPRQTCCAKVPAEPGGGGRPQASARHQRSAPRVSAGDSLDPRSQGVAPHDAVSEQLHRAEPQSRETALLPDAGVRKLRISVAILRGVR